MKTLRQYATQIRDAHVGTQVVESAQIIKIEPVLRKILKDVRRVERQRVSRRYERAARS